MGQASGDKGRRLLQSRTMPWMRIMALLARFPAERVEMLIL